MEEEIEQLIFSASDRILFQEEELTEASPSRRVNDLAIPYKVLIVDDDQGVHSVTRLVLNHFVFNGKKLELISAYSEEEAIAALNSHDDFAIVLLDVVMAHDDSGLKLVKYIRDELKNKMVRIILRTGQPGQAPEKKVILNYDINDYKLKTELTADKLFVAVVAALRSYTDLKTLDNHSKTLRRTIESSAVLFAQRRLSDFVMTVGKQFITILAENSKTFEDEVSAMTIMHTDRGAVIVAAHGEYVEAIGQSPYTILDVEETDLIVESIRIGEKIIKANRLAAYLFSNEENGYTLFMKTHRDLNDWDSHLLEIFSPNVMTAYNNLFLSHEVESTQKEIIFTLGEVAEARSQEMGYHVKRVSEYSRLLAEKVGLSQEDIELIALASPVHDIGKLTIPDAILIKPAKLTFDEFETMKTHAQAGYEIIKNSNRPILKAAAIIAQQHHEKWDGTGYPNHLAGENIHIFGRIVALADVFDALGSERVYKSAWAIEDIIRLIVNESGKHFDPQLVDLFIRNLDGFIMIKNKFSEI